MAALELKGFSNQSILGLYWGLGLRVEGLG